MIYKLRVILDTEKDVFRDLEISDNQPLIELHNVIKKAFDLEGEEMASFYLSNDDWFQGSEIPLEDMSQDDSIETMSQITIQQVIPNSGSKMIYVYDFLNLWTFFVEVIETEVISIHDNFPVVVFEYGQRPEEAPENAMLGEIDFDHDFDENDDDDFLEFGDAYDESDYF